ncbi:MAG TPA: ATP-binding protein [Marmoricola sp.]|nr:ATP-binding protein [Marmoricola sp.]
MPASVIVLAGPSGAGKTRLSRRLGLPVLNLDDFYKDGDDPTLPHLQLAGGAPIVDWDSPGSWSAEDAVEAICDLCSAGRADVPVYEIARNGRVGTQRLELHGSSYFVAEGIFAQEIVGACRDRGVLADAVCVTQSPLVTFLRRLWRDLREHRKPPLVLLRRGLHLVRTHQAVVERAAALGCRVRHPDQAYEELCRLTAGR